MCASEKELVRWKPVVRMCVQKGRQMKEAELGRNRNLAVMLS
jgi:hypothetical protein